MREKLRKIRLRNTPCLGRAGYTKVSCQADIVLCGLSL